MRVEKIGKRQFAFDLLWDRTSGDVGEFVRDKLDEESGYFTVVKAAAAPAKLTFATLKSKLKRRGTAEDEDGADGRAVADVIGYCEGSFKGKVYSYAEALSKLGRDGFYLLPVGDDRFWYAVISNGVVQSATDRTVSKDKLRDLLRTLPSAYGVQVFTSDESLVPGSVPFDPARAVEKIKLAPMRQLGKQENPVLGVLALTVVLGGIGVGGYYYFFASEEAGASQAQIAAQQRQGYLTSAKAALDELPTDAGWAADAYRTAVTSFTTNVGGWALEGFTCMPGQCTAIYVLPATADAYAITPVYDLYGRERVTVRADQRGLNVVLELETPQIVPATDPDVESPAPAPSHLLDTVGRLGMQFAEVTVDGTPQTEVLNASMGAPVSMPSLVRETVKTKHESAIDMVQLRLLSAYMAEASFVATTMTITGGAGAIKPAWNITWVRIHGGNQ